MITLCALGCYLSVGLGMALGVFLESQPLLFEEPLKKRCADFVLMIVAWPAFIYLRMEE